MSNKIVPQAYRTVIDDVITNIRSEFDEYGVSEDVLADLQARWEAKIISSNVADFEPETKSTEPHAVNPSAPPMQASFPPPPPPPHPSSYPHHPAAYPPLPHHQYPTNGALPPISVKAEPGVNEQRYPLAISHPMQMQQGYPLPPPAHPHPPPPQPTGQAPANGSLPAYQQSQQQRRAGGQPPYADVNKGKSREHDVPLIPQLDGPSSTTSSVSSSTPPPGAGLTGTSGNQQRGNQNGPSEEINSDLDDSDSEGEGGEEADTGGPEQDIVFCTYDKVARVKNKWKCVLKDGMVHINGKDYLFTKCTGEFEW